MKEFAIKENHLFSKAYKKGSKFVGRHVVVYILRDYLAKKFKNENPQKEYLNRVGLTVSTKIGGAVVRNRVKRIIREALRHIVRDHKLKGGFLVVIVARNAAVSAKTQDVEIDLLLAFEKLGLVSDTACDKDILQL